MSEVATAKKPKKKKKKAQKPLSVRIRKGIKKSEAFKKLQRFRKRAAKDASMPLGKRLMKTNFFKRSHSGKVIIKAARILRHPIEFASRKTGAMKLSGKQLPLEIPESDGYRWLTAKELDSDKLMEKCRSIYQEKNKELEAIREGTAEKNQFLTELLSDEDLVRHPEIVDFFLQDDLVDAATRYLGCTPILSRVGLWLTTCDEDEPELKLSQFIHYDPEDFRQLKLFVNVFEVTPENGPTTYFSADLSNKIIRSIWDKDKHKRPRPDRYRRYSDEEVRAYCEPEDYKNGCGPAGEGFFVDTARCLHYGSRAKKGSFRLLLHGQYLSYHFVRNTNFSHYDPSCHGSTPRHRQLLTPREGF